jgi:predicted ATPase
MRIAISGTANTGKTTLIKDMVKEWPTFTTPKKTYRSLLKGKKHSKKTTKDTQEKILNFIVDQVQEYSKGDKVIFDRCPLDNLVYSLWAQDKEEGDIDDDFIKKSVDIVKNSMCFYDIIFFIPITKVSPIEIVKDGTRETDPKYIAEIDAIFKAIEKDWNTNPACKFCDPQDRPAFIEIFGKPEERIQLIRMYLDVDGDAIENTNVMDELGIAKDSSGLVLPYQ